MALRHFLLAFVLLAGCSDDDVPPPESATETNVSPAPCTEDEDCGDAGECKPLPGAAADAGSFCVPPGG